MEGILSDEFVEHLTSCQRQLHAYLLTLLADRHQADDVLQETNLVLWRKRADFAPGTNFMAWAYRVTHLQALAYRQKAARDRLVFDDDVTQLMANEASHDDQMDDRRTALEECMRALPSRHRTLLNLRYGSGSSVQVIAEQLHRPANTISQVLHRLRMTLMQCIQRKIAGEGIQ